MYVGQLLRWLIWFGLIKCQNKSVNSQFSKFKSNVVRNLQLCEVGNQSKKVSKLYKMKRNHTTIVTSIINQDGYNVLKLQI